MNRSDAKLISGEVMLALGKIEKKLGVSFSRGNGTFDADMFSLKITATSNAKDGSKQTKEEVDFITNCYRIGLNKEDLGKSFNAQGQSFTICGMKPKSHKYPILAKNTQGKVFKFSKHSIILN